MKKLMFMVTLLATCNSFAQRAEEIKIEDFGTNYDEHSIHQLNPVEIISKKEGNKECLYEEEGVCQKWFNRDVIVLKVSGEAEANFGGHNKVILREETLFHDYSSAKTITQLSLKGVTNNTQGTLVYENMAWAQWGGRIPFEFKIEIHNDMNEETEEREFRVPVSDGKIYSFRVTYADSKWSVENLEARSASLEINGELAESLFSHLVERENDSHANATFLCLKPSQEFDAECFISKWKSIVKAPTTLSNQVFTLAKAQIGFQASHADFNISCNKPNEWNDLKETSCTVSMN